MIIHDAYSWRKRIREYAYQRFMAIIPITVKWEDIYLWAALQESDVPDHIRQCLEVGYQDLHGP